MKKKMLNLKILPNQVQINKEKITIKDIPKEISQSEMNYRQDPTISKSEFPPKVDQYSQKLNPNQIQATIESHPQNRQRMKITNYSIGINEASAPRAKNSKLKCGNQCKSSWQKELQSQLYPKPSGSSSSTLFGQFWSKLWGRAKTSSYLILPSSPSSKAPKKPQEKNASMSLLLNSSSKTDSTLVKPALVKETNPSLFKKLT